MYKAKPTAVGFPVHKSLADFDYSFQTTISKREINGLLDFSFIDNRENVVFIGKPGVGKTHCWGQVLQNIKK